MKKSCHFLSLCFAVLLVSCQSGKTNQWTEQLSEMIETGHYEQAEQRLDSIKTAQGETSFWQADSLKEVIRRLRMDFRLDEPTVKENIRQLIPHATDRQIDDWEQRKLLEYRIIDGEKKYFSKAVRNLILTAPELRGVKDSLGYKDDTQVQITVPNSAEIIAASQGQMGQPVKPIRMDISFVLRVRPNAVPVGETIRCWLPFPQEIDRQTDVQLWATEPAEHYLAPNGTAHRSVYMEKTAQPNLPTLFSINFSYIAHGQYFSPDEMADRLLPYDTGSDLYKTYTAQRNPHVLFSDRIREKAAEIVGNETDPIRKTALIYDWIDSNFPWAGAINYGSIKNIPEYVLDMGHGDCGQVTLLLVTMLRSQGIPAKWESGWMLHPGTVNLHDWGSVYYEGIGWVPIDMSFGNQPSDDATVYNFFKTGIDSYRMVVNTDHNRPLDPVKKHLRSDPVDFQTGEVEWDGGNLYYPDFTYNLSVKYTEL